MYARSLTTISNIMMAAEELFTARNYADVTMADIAQAAEVTKGALYHHFASKEALYLSMMHGFLEEIGETMAEVVAATSGLPCRERLRQFTLTFLEQPARKQELMRLVRRDINVLRDPQRESLIRAYQAALPEQVERILGDGVAAGEIVSEDARLLAWEHVAIVEVVLRPYAVTALASDERTADFVISLFFDGVSHAD